MPALLDNVNVFDAVQVLTPDKLREELVRLDEEAWWATQAGDLEWAREARIKIHKRRKVYVAMLAKPTN